MSLKAFHLIFVIVSTLLSLGVGFWSIREYRLGGAGFSTLLIGLGCLVGAVGLIVYGRWFLRKLRHLSYL